MRCTTISSIGSAWTFTDLTYQQNPGRLDIAEVVAQKALCAGHHRVGHQFEREARADRRRASRQHRRHPRPRHPRRRRRPSGCGEGSCRQSACGQGGGGRRAKLESESDADGCRSRKYCLHGGQANFTDRSVTPNFSAGIQALEGSVLGLSSKSNSRATVDLHGKWMRSRRCRSAARSTC